ncbi:MAG: hypothetical protein ACXVP5_04530 [Tumebacillaceae bacterium]
MNIPLTLYDFMAYLFPAIVTFGILKRELPWLPIWQQTNYQLGSLAVVLVFAYIFGHVIAKLSEQLIEKWPLTRRFFQNTPQTPSPNAILFPGQRTQVRFDLANGSMILKGLSEFYGTEITATNKRLFNLVFPIVQHQMPKRDSFLSIALMMRSLIVIALVYSLFLVAKMLFFVTLWHRYSTGDFAFRYDFFLLSLSLISMLSFKSIYHTYTSLADFVPYSTFLAWYREKSFAEKKQDTDTHRTGS